MSALAIAHLDETALARLGILQGTEVLSPVRGVLGLGWPELERVLPDRGLPRGVVEIAALSRGGRPSAAQPESMRGGTTSIAISAIRTVHAADPQAWCAWVTPKTDEMPSLYAPALVKAGVDLDRLLVVRPEPPALARTLVKVAASGAFEIVVVDLPSASALGRSSKVPPMRLSRPHEDVGTPSSPHHDGGSLVVRKRALAAEESGTSTLLLTSAHTPRSVPWPVAMRLEVERRPEALAVRVTKDRRGERMSRSPQVVPLVA